MSYRCYSDVAVSLTPQEALHKYNLVVDKMAIDERGLMIRDVAVIILRDVLT
jgi:hypothetical protein